MIRTFVYILLGCLVVRGWNDRGACPNDCAGHGRCSQENACICDAGWKTAPDCSQTTCPVGISWTGKAKSANTAHTNSECSSRGICDRNTGICGCFDGYEGLACDRLVCPNNCGEHGKCMTIGNVYKLYGTEFYKQAKFMPNATTWYSKWDADKTTMCFCDYGYTGSACEMRMCPKGDDPLTPFSNYRTITISLRASSRIGGEIQFWINGHYIQFPAWWQSWSTTKCETLFASMPNVDEVECQVGPNTKTIDAYGNVDYVVAFTKFPSVPYENNVWTNNGSLPKDQMYCRTTYMTGTSASCTIADVSVSQLPGASLGSGSFVCTTLIVFLLSFSIPLLLVCFLTSRHPALSLSLSPRNRVRILQPTRHLRLCHGHLQLLHEFHKLQLRHIHRGNPLRHFLAGQRRAHAPKHAV